MVWLLEAGFGMNPKQFKYVLVLAQEGSFSKAAEVLSIRQPSLSQYIKKIEQEVGMELFDRSGGNLCLTDAGRIYIEVGRKMLDLIHQMEERFTDLSEGKTGTITVGISAHRSAALMPRIVKDFSMKYPRMLLRLVEKNYREIAECAEHGEFDLCLTTVPMEDKSFISETVQVEENVLAFPKNVELPSELMEDRRFPAISARELKGLTFVMLQEDHPMQKELDALAAEHGLTLRKKVECTSLQAALEMVKVGLGAALIPACLARPDSKLHYFSIREEIHRREIYLIYRREQYFSEPLKDLLTIIRENMKTCLP